MVEQRPFKALVESSSLSQPTPLTLQGIPASDVTPHGGGMSSHSRFMALDPQTNPSVLLGNRMQTGPQEPSDFPFRAILRAVPDPIRVT